MDELKESIMMLVKAALNEDVGPGDLTTIACLEPVSIKAVIVAKGDGILSGLKPGLLTFARVDSGIVVRPKIEDGQSFKTGDVIVEIEGFNQPILTAERTVLNFLARLSGVATLTGEFVEKVEGKTKIIDTRKTTPGWRLLEKAAVVHGGGENHRKGLYDMVLIKDNHIASCGSIKEVVRKTKDFLYSIDFRQQFLVKPEEIEIEVEVTNEEELMEAIESEVTRLLLDNQTVDSLKTLVAKARSLNPNVKLEASGNVTLQNVAEIAGTGVDYISIGALTHSAPASDFSLKVTERNE